jgi:hypothetical protein
MHVIQITILSFKIHVESNMKPNKNIIHKAVNTPGERTQRQHTTVYLKLWSAEHWWSAGGFGRTLRKLYRRLHEWRIHTDMSVIKLPLLFDLQQIVGELVFSVTSCPIIIILENDLNWCRYVKMWLGNYDRRYNVSPVHLMYFWVWWLLRRWSSVCADRLRNGPPLPKVWETLA